jgi:hypothetical protein
MPNDLVAGVDHRDVEGLGDTATNFVDGFDAVPPGAHRVRVGELEGRVAAFTVAAIRGSGRGV